MNLLELQGVAANNLRILSAAMVEKAKSGHPGGAMGGADFANTLYSQFIVYDPDNAHWHNRDRFFLDPGHMSPMLYGVLSMCGKYSMDDLTSFRQWGSVTPGHPEVDIARGVENTSGPLGQGHAMAVGAAITERFLCARFGEWMSHYTYSFISDGGIQEEISQGAGRIAGYLGLGKLIMFFDANEIQLSTDIDAVTCEDTAMKYRSWGWHVIEIDGNDTEQIASAIRESQAETSKPSLIIGKTIMGKGAITTDGSSFERQCSTHGQPLTAAGADFSATVRNLGGNPEEPFVLFEDTKTLYKSREEELRAIVKQRHEQEQVWRNANPELAKKLDLFFSGKAPEVDYAAINQKHDAATRAGSATVLGVLAQQVENMIVSSADLSNSDKTDGFLKQTHAFTRDDFSGQFLQAGVCELTMACVMNGMALHGGVIPACGTFFVFSDYMKPAIRMAALMELPVKYIWSHDAFRVGEDGPTHQPIEQEAQVRLMEKLKNHSGKNSLLALRPADVHESTVAWKMAMENEDTPTGLILSRQNIKDLPCVGDSYQTALRAERGAYVVKDVEGKADVILLASGSEVTTLVAGEALLAAQGIKARIVSVISEGLFNNQDEAYRNDVLPKGTPIFGLTAGLPCTLAGLVGEQGFVWGLDHFGYSAPFSVLDEKFGFTPEHVCNQVLAFLKR